MSIPNVLVQFTQTVIAEAASISSLKDSMLHADAYQEIKPGRTVRISDVDISDFSPIFVAGEWAARDDNAILEVHFVCSPENQTLEKRLEARQATENMAREWFSKAWESPYLQSQLCAIGKVKRVGKWINIGTVKTPVCVLRLLINPQKAG